MEKFKHDCPTCNSTWYSFNNNPDSLECSPCLVKGRDSLIVKTYELISSAQLTGLDGSNQLEELKSISPKELAERMR